MRKARLREELRRRLSAGTDAVRVAAGESIGDRLVGLPEVQGARRLLVCLSFGVEPDTWGLVDRLLGLGKALYVPRAGDRRSPLTLHRFPCSLETLSFGLRQPAASVPALPDEAIDETIDVALLLGLGFDGEGFRLGYGAGHFDRLLAGRSIPTFGLAFEMQVVPELPREAHDIPLSGLVTERRVLRFVPATLAPRRIPTKPPSA